MRKYISTAVFSVILFTVVILTAINYHNNEVLETRINTLVKYSKVDTKDLNSEKSFKEDYYILQQSHDTNLILVVFGLVVAVIGFFTYQNVVAKFDLISTELKNEIQATKKEGQAVIDKLGDLQIEFYTETATLLKETARSSRARGNTSMYVYYSIASVSKYADFCQWFMNDKSACELNFTDLQKNIVADLERVNRIIASGIEVSASSSEVIEGYIVNIRKIESKEANKVLSQIHSKIKVRV
ncbi:hypothetical protein LPB87_03015 [Flavobacterium sp. EDS]|uniref:hypothetical protein n=1 Tax=Flavobacterium sp. EDS TaxID=2897328 RepID=UPI001E5CA4E7|nr:hypothetical protein [Flavobacterium sp. EDS]MCD0473359.1 hypothetical protein [Flavobacterium sp. EDS]